jgi:hypothetical protein
VYIPWCGKGLRRFQCHSSMDRRLSSQEPRPAEAVPSESRNKTATTSSPSSVAFSRAYLDRRRALLKKYRVSFACFAPGNPIAFFTAFNSTARRVR